MCRRVPLTVGLGRIKHTTDEIVLGCGIGGSIVGVSLNEREFQALVLLSEYCVRAKAITESSVVEPYVAPELNNVNKMRAAFSFAKYLVALDSRPRGRVRSQE